MNEFNRAVAASIAAALSVSLAHGQALRAVASTPDADFDVPTSQVVSRTPTFADTGTDVVGVGMIATFTLVVGDTVDGTGPWALDVSILPTAPGGETGALYNPLGGDVTIADFPLMDGAALFDAPVSGGGEWTLGFSSAEPRSNWTYGLRDVTYYLLADAPGVAFETTATPDPEQTWDRPFFIAGVSSGGPVAYDAMEFTVAETGVYEFLSVRPDGANHYTFLYQGDFDSTAPLDDLVDYGLGNGFDPFSTPRGTSTFSSLLLEGVTYFWVTSQWDRFGSIATAENSIFGPGAVTVAGGGCSGADIAAPFGELDIADVVAFLNAFGAMDAAADLGAPMGAFDIADVVEFLRLFGEGCP